MFEARRLHPIVILINIGKRIKDLFFSILALVFLWNRGEMGKIFLFGAVVLAFVVILITSVLNWMRYTYRLENNELRIEYGIFVRKKRYIPFERIQSLDITEGILQRLCGMVKVQIETAGGSGKDEAEAVLAAISKEEARHIQEYVAAAKNPLAQTSEANAEESSPYVYKISMTQLVLLSLTSGGVGVVISAVLAFLTQVDDLIPFERLFLGFETWAVSNIIFIIILVFIGFIIAWIIALIGTMLKFANFNVVKTEHDLIISQGLLEKRQITIPLNRIQSIRVNENIIRQWLGYGSVYVESAGGSIVNKEGSKVLLLPLVKVTSIGPMLEGLIPGYQFQTNFTPLPKRALKRYMLRSSLWVLPIVVLSIIFLKMWGLLSILILVFLMGWAFLKWKDGGWSFEEQQLNLRYRTIVRSTVFMKKNKIQSLNVKESFFQRRKDLASLEAFVKAGFGNGGGQVFDLEKRDAETIYSWYARKRKQGD